jgi:hypothetical protein
VTITHLVQQLINVISQDQLVGAVLKHERQFKEVTG